MKNFNLKVNRLIVLLKYKLFKNPQRSFFTLIVAGFLLLCFQNFSIQQSLKEVQKEVHAKGFPTVPDGVPKEVELNENFNEDAAPQVNKKPFKPKRETLESILSVHADDSEDDIAVKKYVERFSKVAMAEKEKFGIPASVKMAQAIVETNSGRSKLATDNNNHFGIKCFSKKCAKGHCSNFSDDSHKDFFRKYGSAWESWRAHSTMIANGKYKVLLKYGDDYEKWCRGLKKLGYATASHYDQTLINLIEKYHLWVLDQE